MPQRDRQEMFPDVPAAGIENLFCSHPEMIDRKLIADRLKLVLDPELGMNIVDLGLVYDIACSEESVEVRISMTTMGCPMSRYILKCVENVLSKIPGVVNYNVHVIWHPAWDRRMIDPSLLKSGKGDE